MTPSRSSRRVFRHNKLDLSLIGFTGTFGKTSTSDVLRQILDASGQRAGVLGSLGARYRAFVDPGEGLTTPAPVELHRALRGLADAGATTVILEVTSHALRLDRVNSLRFDGGLLAADHARRAHRLPSVLRRLRRSQASLLARLDPAAPLAFDADNLAARRLAHSRRHALGRDRGSFSRPATGFSLEGRDCEVQFYDILLDGNGATFSLGGRALATQSGDRMHSPLLGRGHLRNVALALTYAIGIGLPVTTAREVVASLTPLRRRMERYDVRGRTILDDTAGHPDSLTATFEVAALLPHRELAVVYAVRGRRGPDINRRNAVALADLCSLHGVATHHPDVICGSRRSAWTWRPPRKSTSLVKRSSRAAAGSCGTMRSVTRFETHVHGPSLATSSFWSVHRA